MTIVPTDIARVLLIRDARAGTVCRRSLLEQSVGRCDRCNTDRAVTVHSAMITLPPSEGELDGRTGWRESIVRFDER